MRDVWSVQVSSRKARWSGSPMRSTAGLIAVVVFMCCFQSVFADTDPLTEEEIRKLLESGVSSDLIVTMIDTRCIDFDIDVGFLTEWSGSADDTILKAMMTCREKMDEATENTLAEGDKPTGPKVDSVRLNQARDSAVKGLPKRIAACGAKESFKSTRFGPREYTTVASYFRVTSANTNSGILEISISEMGVLKNRGGDQGAVSVGSQTELTYSIPWEEIKDVSIQPFYSKTNGKLYGHKFEDINYCKTIKIKTFGDVIHVTGESKSSSGLSWEPPPLPDESQYVDKMTDEVSIHFEFFIDAEEALESFEEALSLARGR